MSLFELWLVYTFRTCGKALANVIFAIVFCRIWKQRNELIWLWISKTLRSYSFPSVWCVVFEEFPQLHIIIENIFWLIVRSKANYFSVTISEKIWILFQANETGLLISSETRVVPELVEIDSTSPVKVEKTLINSCPSLTWRQDLCEILISLYCTFRAFGSVLTNVFFPMVFRGTWKQQNELTWLQNRLNHSL